MLYLKFPKILNMGESKFLRRVTTLAYNTMPFSRQADREGEARPPREEGRREKDHCERGLGEPIRGTFYKY